MRRLFSTRARLGAHPGGGWCFVLLVALAMLVPAVLWPTTGSAQTRLISIRFEPTARAQMALWISSADGTRFKTIRLTQAVATRGIGNRPGALQMNSGFRWPYGRREGVLPIWAHARASQPGAELFPKVIFQDRLSEGHASRSANDFSRDDYFCLSFNQATTSRDALDAVSCASVFNSDKGRYLTASDVDTGYAEPAEVDGTGLMAPLQMGSLYPPRRDVTRCTTSGCYDHPDVGSFADTARQVMPDIDAVTMATLRGDLEQSILFTLPEDWPAGDYVVHAEVNVEGDYNASFGPDQYPTPADPSGMWDTWAINYGYPYRGQPSVVYSVPITVGEANTFTTDTIAGYGELEGRSGEVFPLTPNMITDDRTGAPGSGVDRLHTLDNGARLEVEVVAANICESANPPPECGQECSDSSSCQDDLLVCSPQGECVGMCDVSIDPPQRIPNLIATRYPDEKHSHEWGLLSFTVPQSIRPLSHYVVRMSATPIVDGATFDQAMPALEAEIDSVQLEVPADLAPGTTIDVEFGGMQPELEYHIAVQAVDECNQAGPFEVTSLTTTKVNFTTVSPCFVATAAFGSPMAQELGPLRSFRDRYLLSHAPGQWLVKQYYRHGPRAASFIATRPRLRSVTRALLRPVVWVADWLKDSNP